MDALLPSEIARLVLGYLQDQKCEEAARIFMETSSLLQECRIVSQRGGRYSTKVGGLSLTDILDKYCAANAMIQEKLHKTLDSEQLKQCNDILEQLRILLEGSRGHRFVVNINVPSQNSPVGNFGTPNVSSSSRKRHHSHHERGKRAVKSLNSLIDKSSQNPNNYDVSDAVFLENLSDQMPLIEQVNTENKKFCSNKSSSITDINNTKDNRINVFPSINVDSDVNLEVTSSNINSCYKDQATETVQTNNLAENINKCTAGTSTDELMTYCTAEVQTGTSDFVESESDVNDEPIENLSILTKELINRTELQERIAENINRAILPIEASFREDGTNVDTTDANKSKLCEYDNVIKSAVKATETDLEEILREIFSVNEIETSTKKDSDVNPMINNQINHRHHEFVEINHCNEPFESTESNFDNQEELLCGSEIPLKQRLRSSSRCQNAHTDEEEKDSDTLLENQNAEAVMNIVNVIASKRNSLTNSEEIKDASAEKDLENAIPDVVVIQPPLEKEVQKSNANIKITKPATKKYKKKPGSNKRKRQEVKTTEEDVMPTLILCSEREIEPCYQTDKYIPIVPKLGEPSIPSVVKPPALFLRTVNVPRHLVKSEQVELSNTLIQNTLQQFQPKTIEDPTIIAAVSSNDKIPTSTNSAITESITLYGGEEVSNPGMTTVSSIVDMPIINIDGSLISSSGLSPFLKNTVAVDDSSPQVVVITNLENEIPLAQPSTIREATVGSEKKDGTNEPVAINQVQSGKVSQNPDEIITKYTPNTLLRSRAKNNRLSLSTPRRRNSHVRALDFSTPVKPTSKKVSQSCVKPSVCRGGLFKSPTYDGSSSIDGTPEIKSPVAKKVRTLSPQPALLQVPIATRSPAPKLQGNWNKIAGIGLILGETSESSPEKSTQESPISSLPTADEATSPVKLLEKSWDSDLRKIVGTPPNENEGDAGTKTSKKKTTKIKISPKIEEKKGKRGLEKSYKTNPKESNKNDDGKKEEREIEDLKLKNGKNIVKELITKNNINENPNIVNDVKKDQFVNNDVNLPSSSKKDINQEISLKNNEVHPSKFVDSTLTVTSTGKLQVSAQKTLRITPPSLKKINPLISRDDHMLMSKTHITRNSLESLCIASTLLDLETPRKIQGNLCTPPTPRVFATPAHHLVKSDRLKSTSEVSFKDIVDTPEFPVTPCIVVTPKIVEEDAQKRPSPYYEPSEETKETNIKEVVSTEKIRIQETTTTIVVHKSIVELQDHQAIKITRFGVEKSIESKGEDDQILNVKSNSENSTNDTSKDTSRESVEIESIEDENTSANVDTDSNDESNSSSSSSSSSSSASSSSSSSCSSTVSSPTKSVTNSQETQSSIDESEYDSPDVLMASFSKINQKNDSTESQETHSSPEKVFPVLHDRSDEPVKETPIKEDNEEEAVIFETPSVSESERALRRDSIANLNSNISVAITSVESNNSSAFPQKNPLIQSKETSTADSTTENIPNESMSLSKVRITKVEKIAATDGMAIQVSKMLQSGTHITSISTIQNQTNINSDAKLSQELEEKRLRVMAKFKESSHTRSPATTKKHADDNKQKKVFPVGKKSSVENIGARTAEGLKNRRKSLEVTPSAGKNIDKNESKEIVITKEKEANKTEEKITNNREVLKKNQEIEIKKDKIMVTRGVKTENINNEKDDKDVKKCKGKLSPRKKTEKSSDKHNKTESSVVDAKLKQEIMQLVPKETAAVTTTAISVENVKGISKAKVDQVKRDLFSDEENSDQRTTRSQALRRTSTVTPTENRICSDENTNANIPVLDTVKEKLPGKLLECLQLIPANKINAEIDDLNSNLSDDTSRHNTSNVGLVSVVYDESVPIKKRKRNYSNSELQKEYIFQYPEETHVLEVTPLEELFKIDLKTKTKKKKQVSKKSPLKEKKSKTFKNVDQPVATSSPFVSTLHSKIEDNKRKTSKRKSITPVKEEKGESKIKADPQELFKKIKIDEFLKSVHVAKR